ncbi:MAG TPA: YdcF family protein [Longimicrobiaceae bacterium]|nr:YdcF family protein [Longimicrobiaceae bacterium]
MVRVLRACGGVLVVVAFVWATLAIAVFLFGRRNEAQPADVIVVLGAAQYNGHPSPVLRSRLDHAIDLYREGIAPRLILTGGVGVGDTVSEAAVGRRYAIRNGVPADRIDTERSGVSSEESMRNVADLMGRLGFHSAVLVSDPFHMLRLRIISARLGIRSYSSPTRTSPIRANSGREWRHVVRESVILPYALFSGG